jgi:hypothetical protein
VKKRENLPELLPQTFDRRTKALKGCRHYPNFW